MTHTQEEKDIRERIRELIHNDAIDVTINPHTETKSICVITPFIRKRDIEAIEKEFKCYLNGISGHNDCHDIKTNEDTIFMVFITNKEE